MVQRERDPAKKVSCGHRRRLDLHAIQGSSWESFAMEQVLHSLDADHRLYFFWSAHTGAELDLVLKRRCRWTLTA